MDGAILSPTPPEGRANRRPMRSAEDPLICLRQPIVFHLRLGSEALWLLEKLVQTVEEHARSPAVDDPVIEREYQVRFGDRYELAFFLGPGGFLFPRADAQNERFTG